MAATPAQVASGRSPPPGLYEDRDYWEDEDRIRSLSALCFDDGVYPTEIDPGEMIVEGREVRFKLNTSPDDIEVKWLKKRTVTIIYRDAARFLSRKIKDDLVRAFEDGWVIGNEALLQNQRRGRIKIEGPGVASYVAKAKEVAEYMISEQSVEVNLGNESYRVQFKPWMTRAEFRELRKQEEDRVFWVMALQVPLDDMPFIYAQIEKAIGVAPVGPGLFNNQNLFEMSNFNGEQLAAWQGGTISADWLVANGIHPALWAGMLNPHGGVPARSQMGGNTQQPNSTAPGREGGQGMLNAEQPFGGGLRDGTDGGTPGPNENPEGSTSKPRGIGKQRRLSLTFVPGVTPEPSRASRLSRSGSEKSVSQEVGMVTPGQKTTRDRRLASTRDQSSKFPQFLVPLVCTAFRNSLWVVTWQKNLGPPLVFGQAVSEIPSTLDIERSLKNLYLDAIPMRVIPDVVMARILFGPTGSKVKYYVPLVDARLTEQKLSELKPHGLRLIPLATFAEAKKQELAKFMISPTMMTADALAELKMRLPKEKKLDSIFLKTTLTQSWPDIACLQETKLDNEKIGELGRWWDGPQIWYEAQETRGGVGILIHRDLAVQIVDYFADLWGRWVWVVLKSGDLIWAVVSVYAPVRRSERIAFWDELRVSLPDVDEVIIDGDWNTVLDSPPDQRGHGCAKDVLALVDLMLDLDLQDVYRTLRPAEPGYTWFSHRGKGRRLDYLLVGGGLKGQVINVEEVINPVSDHKPVIGQFNLAKEKPRGRGYFKLNTQNLHSEGLNKWTQGFWERWQKQKERFPTLADWWETGSRILSRLLDVFSRILALSRNKEERKCQKRVQDAEEKMKRHPISERAWGKERAKRLAEWDKKQQEKSELWAKRLKMKGLEVYDRMSRESFQKLTPARNGPALKELRHPFDPNEPVAVEPEELCRRQLKSEFWRAVLLAWRRVKPDIISAPCTKGEVLAQIIFENQNIRDNRGMMLMANSEPGSFGKAWVKRGVVRLRDLWNEFTGDWRSGEEMVGILRPGRYIRQRRQLVLDSIPKAWLQILSPAKPNPVGTWYEVEKERDPLAPQLREFVKLEEISEEGRRKFQRWQAQNGETNLSLCKEEEHCSLPGGPLVEIRVRETVSEEGDWKVKLWNVGAPLAVLKADPDQWAWRSRESRGEHVRLDEYTLELGYKVQEPHRTPLMTATQRWTRVLPDDSEKISNALQRCSQQLVESPFPRAATILWLASLLATPSTVEAKGRVLIEE
ncbi:hypothetical protein CBR_g21838 [Chara braunii]|uniref:Endonuclease/exonuclease/phosphatase domain-containing protein n=1 Tax=Chara braunii TaxID=69332 RepID=A0A388JUN4_CHABU|nr:hypothetical protein CBR_g21838 [Chara braunii]|eukprot:GBG61495.1 hypothetical protein CBR_g21838 [Chara braunii]